MHKTPSTRWLRWNTKKPLQPSSPGRSRVFDLLMVAVALIVLVPLANAQVNTRTVDVWVRSAANQPIEGATVCWSSSDLPNQWWGLRTNAQGTAQLRVPLPQASNAQPGNPIGGLAPGGLERSQSVTIVATSRSFTKQITRPVQLTRADMQLPAVAGGAGCPSGVKPQAGDASLVDLLNVRSAVERLRAELSSPPNSPVSRVPNPNVGERCFGALGMQCGQAEFQLSSCANGRCLVNQGSWTHDECCASNPGGFMCGGQDGRPGNRCAGEFLLGSLHLSSTPYNWRRNVDFNRVNRTGIVERALYCAPAGTFQPGDNARFCCSQRLEGLDTLDIAYLGILDPKYVPLVAIDRMKKCS